MDLFHNNPKVVLQSTLFVPFPWLERVYEKEEQCMMNKNKYVTLTLDSNLDRIVSIQLSPLILSYSSVNPFIFLENYFLFKTFYTDYA